jgi:hypothetical protein
VTRFRRGYSGQASDEEPVRDTLGDLITRHPTTHHFPLWLKSKKLFRTGEMTQRFIEFVMMHAQNAALFLGQIPNPKTGEAEINLDLARMFIDQLEMIQEKTRGNSQTKKRWSCATPFQFADGICGSLWWGATEPSSRRRGAPDTAAQPEPPPPASTQPAEQPASGAAEQKPPISSAEPETESRKKFTKSYGP